MAIKIKIGTKNKPEPIIRKFELKIRKSLDGNLMIFDHADIDIVIMPSKKKVLALPKETMSDAAYGAQNRLFAHLKRKGVVDKPQFGVKIVLKGELSKKIIVKDCKVSKTAAEAITKAGGEIIA